MTQLTETITEAINKNLPQQIGQELQKELAELAALRIKSDKQTEAITSYRDKIADHEKTIEALQAQLSKHTALDAREAAVRARELKQDFNEFQVAQAKERREEMLGLVGMVFRSPVYQTHVIGKIPVPVEGMAPSNGNSYGSPGTVLQGDISLSTTKSQL